ncbi:MAG TPA: menaquinone biosynthesis protein [Malonomonas sp.]
MSSRARLVLGHIPYLNCVPFFHYLKQEGFQGELVSGVPSELNLMLQRGELSASPSSSFEYARNWQDYVLLPGHSISSSGKVHSVLLFSPVPLSELEGQQIAITGESATSINLLRIILREFNGLLHVADAVPECSVEQEVAEGRPALLIGDRALRLANAVPKGMRSYDLGELWYQYTGLPFVFALWMIRREALAGFSQELTQLTSQLQRSRQRVMQDSANVAATVQPASGLTVPQVVDYWHRIDYRLEATHLKGLQLFFKLCVKNTLLKEVPPLDFFSNNPAVGAISG